MRRTLASIPIRGKAIWLLAAMSCLLGGIWGRAEIVDDFESGKCQWQFYGGWEHKGATGGIEFSTNQVHQGQRALVVRGDFSGGGFYVGTQRRVVPAIAVDTLQFAVLSPTIDRLGIRVTDSTGQVHQQQVSLKPSNKWQIIKVHPLNKGEKYGHFGGDVNDGLWHGPMTAVFIGFDKKALPKDQPAGQIVIDQVEAIASTP